MKNTDTKFPDKIDERIFAQDIDLSQTSIVDSYNTFLNAGRYTRASDILNSSGVFFYGAWILNLFENRLCEIGKYILNMEKPKLDIYSLDEPNNVELGTVWIGDN